MNSNLFHNLANVAIAVLGVITAVLVATGCVEVAGALDCSQSWLNPKWTSIAIAALAALKSVVNFFRDGLGGMAKPQPPVDK
jgi:hypothetical protein